MIKKISIYQFLDPRILLETVSRITAETVLAKIERDLRDRMNKEFYTLEELKKADHPYATRHFGYMVDAKLSGRIFMSGGLPSKFRIDVISRRKGGFDNVIIKQVGIKIYSNDTFSIGRLILDPSRGPNYVKYILLGTRKVIPRPLTYFYLLENFFTLQEFTKQVFRLEMRRLKTAIRKVIKIK